MKAQHRSELHRLYRRRARILAAIRSLEAYERDVRQPEPPARRGAN